MSAAAGTEASTSGQAPAASRGKRKSAPTDDAAWNFEEEQADEEEALADMHAFNREYDNDNSWEQLQEDEYGHLRPLDVREEQRAKRKRLLSAAASARIRRGMIRYLTVILDMSRAASMTDMRPNRGAMMIQILQLFVREFFDQNPLSHLSIMLLRNGRAERLTDLSGSPASTAGTTVLTLLSMPVRHAHHSKTHSQRDAFQQSVSSTQREEAHISKLKEGVDAGGDASLQNGLDMAVASLKSVPPYGHREVTGHNKQITSGMGGQAQGGEEMLVKPSPSRPFPDVPAFYDPDQVEEGKADKEEFSQLKEVEPSETAALEAGVKQLQAQQPVSSAKVLLLFAGLSTCDPGNILDSIKAAKQQRVRASVIGLAAEVRICRVITDETGGIYSVGMSDKHVEECVMEHAPPPPTKASASAASLVHMGFPQRAADGPTAVAFVGPDCLLQSGGFTCPRCKARVLDLPSACHVCGLTLVSSSQLARSYHHLFPVKPFTEVPSNLLSMEPSSTGTKESASEERRCHGCSTNLSLPDKDEQERGVVLQCSGCKHLFCFDCDLFIHESLHNCPGCEASAVRQDSDGEDEEDAMAID